MQNEQMKPEEQHYYLSWQKSNKRGKIATGIIVIIFGILYLLKETGTAIPHWVFTPGMFISSIGFIALIKHKFRSIFPYILIVIGKLLLLNEVYPESINMKIVWPSLVILGGVTLLVFSFRKRPIGKHGRHGRHWHEKMIEKGISLDDIAQDDFIDSVSIFGGVKKTIVSKSFLGADIVAIFGGSELNLSQADFEGRIVMDVTNIFGGTTLTIPNNWQVKTEVVSIFGGIEDKRPVQPPVSGAPERTVVLRGTCLFGGIEINSFASN